MKKKKPRTQQNGNEGTALALGEKASRCSSWLALFSLLVALFGGVPGFLALKAYLDRSSVRIIFDQNESVPCIVANSPNNAMEGKFAILLYGVTIVGKGAEHFVAYDVTVSIRSKGVWHEGRRFQPVQRESRDRNGPTPAVVRLYVGVQNLKEVIKERAANGRVDFGDAIMLGDWRDFRPGIKLGFGEPATFMVATYFPDTPSSNVSEFDRIRIVLRDYLGNEYSEEYERATLRKIPHTLFLDQSPP
jgi:hypothetical protein